MINPAAALLPILALSSLLAAQLPVTSALKRRAPADRPNFVVLFMDDLGYGDLGFTGHPTTRTPNIDKLAWNGRVLTTWYSGCAVCSGSRAALMTGRQYPRTGVPGVFGPTGAVGLPMNETTIAEQLKAARYATGAVGKWHLGQRLAYLPGSRGFDYYLGIPYSDDMGNGLASDCPSSKDQKQSDLQHRSNKDAHSSSSWHRDDYENLDFLHASRSHEAENDPAGRHLPLVYQEHNRTRVVEQPLDFTKLAEKYNAFAVEFIRRHKDNPFFLYVPFSHVHVTSHTQPEWQYSGCQFKGSTARGAFGDALAESDWIVGNIMKTLQDVGIEENTLVLFASDNGPWLPFGLSGGSEGLFTGRYAGYWNTGKASTWEGGIRSPAFAYWKGKIEPFSRSSEIVSSMDVFPTLSALSGVPLPNDRVIDGRDMSDVLLGKDGKSKHDFLFFYGTCHLNDLAGKAYGISAVRHGRYKAHWCTAPGLGGNRSQTVRYDNYPLLFDVEKDPSESQPISTGNMPSDREHSDAMTRIMKAYAFEKATFTYGKLVPVPDAPGEGPGRYGICCDRSRDCDCSGDEDEHSTGFFNIGTKAHHVRYHDALGEEEPSPPTLAQVLLANMN